MKKKAFVTRRFEYFEFILFFKGLNFFSIIFSTFFKAKNPHLFPETANARARERVSVELVNAVAQLENAGFQLPVELLHQPARVFGSCFQLLFFMSCLVVVVVCHQVVHSVHFELMLGQQCPIVHQFTLQLGQLEEEL
jgi:hypothetical protein